METYIYPGSYRPIHRYPKKIRLKSHPKDEFFLHDAHFSNDLNGYVSEIPMPGCLKENIQLYTNGDILYILVHNHTASRDDQYQVIKLHLSEKADHAFISAYFHNGVLHVFIPETDHPVTADNDHIVVY